MLSTMKPIGTYRVLIASGGDTGEHIYGRKQYFGLRQQYLPAVRCMAQQILVQRAFGQFVWINMYLYQLDPGSNA